MKHVITTFAFLGLLGALSGCATQGKPPPVISLDESVKAQPLPEPAKPVAALLKRLAPFTDQEREV